jgi:hypothetical protein
MSAPASASVKRTITIDSSLQGSSKRTGKNKLKSAKNNTGDGMKPKLKPNQFIRPSTLKKQLLARIKNHQKKHSQSSSLAASAATPAIPAIQLQTSQQPSSKSNSASMKTPSPAVPPPPTSTSTSTSAAAQLRNETFAQSLEYLQTLATNSRENRHNNNKQRNKNHNKTHKAHPSSHAVGTTSAGMDAASQPQVFLDAFPSSQPPPLSLVQTIPAINNNSINSNNSNNRNNTNNNNNDNSSNIVAFPTPSIPEVSVLAQAPPPGFQAPIQEQVTVALNDEPRWGCLKGGIKPTFRTFHNKTLKNNEPVAMNLDPFSPNVALDMATTNTNYSVGRDSSDIGNSDVNVDDGAGVDTEEGVSDAVAMSESLYGTRQQRLEAYRQEQIKSEKKTVEPTVKIKQTKQRIITKKYKLGKYNNKTGPVIGVLIKNVQTQRNVERKRNELRRIPLDTIITRLHKKRLLKVGSTAPPDILREMYESAVLAGDIENEGNDIALHNFLSGDDTTDANH